MIGDARSPEPGARQKRDGRCDPCVGVIDALRVRQDPRPRTARSKPCHRARARVAHAPARPRSRARGRSGSRIGLSAAAVASAVSPAFSDERPGRRLSPVVEDRLAHELDLDGPLQALDRPHEQVFRVVVSRWPGVRGDLVLMVARPHRQGVAHHESARRCLPRCHEHVRPGLVPPGCWVTDPERAESELSTASRSRRLPKTLGSVKRRNAEPVDRPVRRDERAGVAVRQERVVGDRGKRRKVPRRFARGGPRRGGSLLEFRSRALASGRVPRRACRLPQSEPTSRADKT